MRCYLFKNGYWGWEFGKKGRRCCACYWRINKTPIDITLHGFDSCRQCRRAVKEKDASCLSSLNIKDPAFLSQKKATAVQVQSCRLCSIRIEPGSKEGGSCLSQYHPTFGPNLGTEGCCLCIWLGRKQTTIPMLTIHQPLYGMRACQTCIQRVQTASQRSSGVAGWDSMASTPIAAARAPAHNAAGAGWDRRATQAYRDGAAMPAEANPSWRRRLFVDVGDARQSGQ